MGANKSFLSVYGMYCYDDSLFDNMVIPENMDKDTLVDNLCMELSELECIYPDAGFMKFSIGAWSKKELPVWEKLQATTELEYNPIWNKDGKIIETETRDLLNHGKTHGETTGDSETDANLDVSAFNSTTYEPREQTHQETSDGTETDTSFENADQGTVKHERIETGNIGITTTQQMINEEREVDKFNLMDYIINSFKNRFCVLVY